MSEDRLTMVVPAASGSVPLVRLVAAHLAAQCGFDYDRVEDVRVAVGEGLRLLAEASVVPVGPSTNRWLVRFVVVDEAFDVELALTEPVSVVAVDAASEHILAATATTHRATGIGVDPEMVVPPGRETNGVGPYGIAMHFDPGAPS